MGFITNRIDSHSIEWAFNNIHYGAETAQYGLELIFKSKTYWNWTLCKYIHKFNRTVQWSQEDLKWNCPDSTGDTTNLVPRLNSVSVSLKPPCQQSLLIYLFLQYLLFLGTKHMHGKKRLCLQGACKPARRSYGFNITTDLYCSSADEISPNKYVGR